ncbi:MAG: alanine racemase [Actinomycetota bacterium]
MSVRLTIKSAIWRGHVVDVVNRVDGLVPVVKGNGYGFGRRWLAERAAEFADTVAVGNMHEIDGLPESLTPVVLTPVSFDTLRLDDVARVIAAQDPILTVGSPEHVAALDHEGWRGRVLVKLASSMQRYGRDADLVGVAEAAGLEVVGVSIHPPVAGDDAAHLAEVEESIAAVPTTVPVWVSHLGVDAHADLVARHPDRSFRLRLGTGLWHGDKRAFHLTADVLDVRPIRAGERAGYHQGEVTVDGWLIMIGAGTANGVVPLDDGRSPFHFDRRRLDLHERPHMHTSMVVVADGDTVPRIGARVDVQRPLITTLVDEFDWI